jgi:oxygen-dependent protoporphyrinogen oxidase
MATVVVIGGGITGLTAALRLRQVPNPPDVILLESSNRLGGKILTTPFAGLPAVDAGPDAVLARVPWATDLFTELGLGDELVAPAVASASIWWDHVLHPIPDGLVLGVPAGLPSLARSKLLTGRGKARAAVEPLRPRGLGGIADNLGAAVRHRFGDEVLERLVDPLLGGINAGDADRLSLSAAAPQIAEVAARHRSLLLGLRLTRPAFPRRAKAAPPPVFLTPRAGLGSVIERLTARLGDVDVRLGHSVDRIGRTPGGWRIDGIEADAIILAAPAGSAATVLRGVSSTAARLLGGIPYASVAMVTLAFDRPDVGHSLDGSGYLVPKPQQKTVTACSFGSSKWPHWQTAGQVIVRASLGRDGNDDVLDGRDEEIVATAVDELREPLQLRSDPVATRVTRWPQAFPQYRPGHLERVKAIDETMARDAAGIVVAGAAYRGVGIPACIRQGGEAARAALGYLASR